MDALLDDSRDCLCGMPTDTLFPSWYSWHYALCTQQEPHKTLVGVAGTFSGVGRKKKLEFSDTLALREVSGAQGGKICARC